MSSRRKRDYSTYKKEERSVEKVEKVKEVQKPGAENTMLSKLELLKRNISKKMAKLNTATIAEKTEEVQKTQKHERKSGILALMESNIAFDRLDPANFDRKLSSKKPMRKSRMNFNFNDPGKYVAIGERVRARQQAHSMMESGEEIRDEAVLLNEIEEARSILPTPDVEWWDEEILDDRKQLVESKITNIVEHVPPLAPAKHQPTQITMPAMLTQQERKKLRKQRRMEALKEKQDLVRLGLAEAPKAKVKLSNMMRVRGDDAILDPTRVESEVAEEVAQREIDHQRRNAENKLTDTQRREKKMRKIQKDRAKGLRTLLLRLNRLDNKLHRIKVDANAQQNYITGMVLISPKNAFIIAEGGEKSIRRYRHLMLDRIKWEEDTTPTPNYCTLVWEAELKKPSFKQFRFENFDSADMARNYLSSRGLESYWNLFVNSEGPSRKLKTNAIAESKESKLAYAAAGNVAKDEAMKGDLSGDEENDSGMEDGAEMDMS